METPIYIGDIKLAHKTTEGCLTIVDGDIETYINAVLNSFIKENDLNLRVLEDRIRIYEFLQYQISEFDRYSEDKYMLNDKYLKRAELGKKIILEILSNYKTNGL